MNRYIWNALKQQYFVSQTGCCYCKRIAITKITNLDKEIFSVPVKLPIFVCNNSFNTTAKLFIKEFCCCIKCCYKQS